MSSHGSQGRVVDGVAVMVLLGVVGACFFGTILALPYAGAGGGVFVVVTVEAVLILLAAMLFARRRSIGTNRVPRSIRRRAGARRR